jgi:hypothetical protein
MNIAVWTVRGDAVPYRSNQALAMAPQPQPTAPLRRTLDKYAALTGAFLGSAAVAQAGVVYTDVDPDALAQNSGVDIDFNADGIVDFRLNHGGFNSFFTSYGVSYGFGYNFIALYGDPSAGYGFVAPSSGNFYALALSAGTTIGPASPITLDTFASVGFRFFSIAGTFSSSASNGYWAGQQDKYFGVRFNVGADTYYGWIRADVSSGYGSAVVKDFAYEDQPGVAIVAGDTGSGTSCSTVSPPSNQAHVNEATRVRLTWDPQPGAVACQVQGQRLPTGPAPSVNILSGDLGTTNVPYAVAGAGTTWTWRVRCACSITPLDVSAFTAYGDTFSIPLAREAELAEKPLAYPNPATDQVLVNLGSAVERETEVRVLDLTGRTVDFMRLPAEARNLELDVTGLTDGVYFVQVGELDPVTIEVIH